MIIRFLYFTVSLTTLSQYVKIVGEYFEAANFSVDERIKFSKVENPQKWGRGDRDAKRVDSDFLFMALSDIFVMSGGGFSRFIGHVVQELGGTVPISNVDEYESEDVIADISNKTTGPFCRRNYSHL